MLFVTVAFKTSITIGETSENNELREVKKHSYHC